MAKPPCTVPPEGKPYPDTTLSPALPALEREVLEYWEDQGVFEDTLDPERADPHPIDGGLQETVAYDLPPITRRLASPTDLLAGYVHDTYCRIKTMRGWVVPRPWIQPRHGIPVELVAQERLELPDREAIEAHGVDAFVTECAGVASETDVRWMNLLRRQGHWLSFEEGFSPSIPDQIASIWWAFEVLHGKGLIYEGTALAPYSESLGTPLAGHEVRLAGDGALRSPYGDEDTPEKEVTGWFLTLDPIREKVQRVLEDTQWYPRELQEEAVQWVQHAGDWCLSRERYWGTPVPVWKSAEGTRVLGSIEELAGLIGDDIPTDFHRGTLDELELPSASGGPPLRRVPQVLDAWFDAACMPFARVCYPAAAKEFFEARHPAGFTTQSRRHVRGWWFVMAALSTVLFEKPAVLNVVGHAEVKAPDGQEMGELAPEEAIELLDRHGSDHLRWSLLQGGVTHPTLRLPEHEAPMLSVLWSSFDLFCRNANDLGDRISPDDWPEYPEHDMDRWLLTKLHRRYHDLLDRLDYLDLEGACGSLGDFIEDLTWWGEQVTGRLNTPAQDSEGWRPHLLTLHEVLTALTRIVAPFAPYLADVIHLSLAEGGSVHLERWPDIADLRTFKEAETTVDDARGRS